MALSQLARTINESITLKLNQTAALLREKGEPVIHLGGGEPKSKAPIDAIISCTAVLNSGDIKYTPPDGIPALKKAIIRYTEELYGRKVRRKMLSLPAAPSRPSWPFCTPCSTPRTKSSSLPPIG